MSLRPSVLQYVAVWVKLVPPALGLLTMQRRRHPAVGWILVWCVLLTLQSVLTRALGLQGLNNMWVAYVFLPITTGVALWALAHWQTQITPRLAFRLAIPLVVLASAALTLLLENTRAFSLAAAPFHALVLLTAALWTFFHLAHQAEDALYRHDWFWILGGIILYGATTAAFHPLGWFFLARQRPELLLGVWTVSAASWILAFSIIAWGVVCPILLTSSGGSSSLRSSRSLSWSAGSPWPW